MDLCWLNSFIKLLSNHKGDIFLSVIASFIAVGVLKLWEFLILYKKYYKYKSTYIQCNAKMEPLMRNKIAEKAKEKYCIVNITRINGTKLYTEGFGQTYPEWEGYIIMNNSIGTGYYNYVEQPKLIYGKHEFYLIKEGIFGIKWVDKSGKDDKNDTYICVREDIFFKEYNK
jgi:hypothetical protein